MIPVEVFREVAVPAGAAPALPARPSAAPTLVRVSGQIHRGGRPLTGYGLSFLTLGPGGPTEERDWDFTDEDGRFAVELTAARYLVRNDDGAELADLVVLADREELPLDIDLAAR